MPNPTPPRGDALIARKRRTPKRARTSPRPSGATAYATRCARKRRTPRSAKGRPSRPWPSARRSARRARTSRAKSAAPVSASSAANCSKNGRVNNPPVSRSTSRLGVLTGVALADDLRYDSRRASGIASLRMADLKRFLVGAVLLLAAACAAAQAPRKAASLEGVTEWQFANGLKLLTVPDPGLDTITGHITYLVGSRHEGYGEKGMEHILEHLLTRGSKGHPRLKEEFSRRGARWNGTTSDDRTNYFETLPASFDNLEWAIAMEADRMRYALVTKANLDVEMTVVRNEFELGENRPGAVLFQRMQQLAFPWHRSEERRVGKECRSRWSPYH